MEISGEQRIDAAQPEVWRALNDPDVLKSCIPGCESIDRVAGDEFRIVMLAAVGPVKARFTGTLAIRNSVPLHSYELVFEGSGGVAGFGKGTAVVALSPQGDAITLLRYTATAQVGGRLAQIGSRLIDGVAKKLAIDFFARFNKQFSADAAAAPVIAVPPGTAARAPALGAGARASGPGASVAAALALPGGGLVVPLRIIAAGVVVADIALLGILYRLWSM